MSVVKIIEISCEGKTIEEAMQSGVNEAAKSIKNIKQIDVQWIHGHVEHNRIISFRVNAKISFVVEH